MKEELTTKMQIEFCKDENEKLDLIAMQIDIDVFEDKRMTLKEALKYYGISWEQFVLHSGVAQYRMKHSLQIE